MTSAFADLRPVPEAESAQQGEDTHNRAPTTPVEAFGLRGAAEIFAPLPPLRFLVEGAIPAGSLVLLTGYGGDRKSWLGLALAIGCVTGSAWLAMKCSAGAAVVLDYENSFSSTQRRIQRLARGHGHSIPLSGIYLGRPQIYLSQPGFASTLDALLEERPNVKLMIIDTLRAACPGIDENASTIREHIDRLRPVAERHGIAIVFLAHARKASINTSGASRRERIRGSSALFDAVDVVFDVSASKDGVLSIQQTKGRESREFLALTAHLVDTPNGDIRLELSAGTVPTLASQGLRQSVLAAVGQHPGRSLTRLLEAVQGRKEDVAATVRGLLSEGILTNRGSEKHFQLHIGPPGPALSPGLFPNGRSVVVPLKGGEPRNHGMDRFPEPPGTAGTTGA